MQLGFIDFSRDERNKILATLDLLGEHTALDELGIGTIRDAYADILFPGISTIQTRAKYFVLIPHLFNIAAIHQFSNGRELHKWLTNREDKLVETLVRNSGDEYGIIGSRALQQQRAVKQKPSSIYWNGLRTFGILRDSKASISAVCNAACAIAKRKSNVKLKADSETFDDMTADSAEFTLFSPISPDYELDTAITINLTHKEAAYLADKITNATSSKGTLLAFLIINSLNCDSFDEIPTDILPQTIRDDYLRAKAFSDFIFGAHIRYNVIYSEYRDTDMAVKFTAWRDEFDARNFELTDILTRVSCNYATGKFCESFLAEVRKNDTDAIDELLITREIAVKAERAKLRKPTEYPYARPVYNNKLDFRFGTAKTIISDIISGLEQ
ncbi:MAG: DUF6361 family protein [Oscillospiraceae bacterium]|jgi:hypothetical protein|nr:DUF6361 family protein [Oscillospiraceae bacterium]